MAVISGTSGDDTKIGTGGADTINGLGGNDTLYGLGGADILNGGGGNDKLYGGGGNDELNGGAGNDKLYGEGGNDVLNGGDGNDQLFGGAGTDILSGGAGNDIIDGGAGNDYLDGGAGADTFVFYAGSGNDTITGYDSSDTIDLTAFTSITNQSQLSIVQSGSDVIVTGPGVSFTVEDATIAQVAHSITTPCLMRGTMVRTPAGEVRVETLAIGDLVVTIDGKAETLKWVGTRGYSRSFVEASLKIAPVLFEPGSLGLNQPSRDLYVSPEHAVLVDHALVPAALLVNGSSIRQVSDFDTVEYFHLEFETPQVIFTDGAATESYVNHDNRRMFQNYQSYVDLYGDEGVAKDRLRRFEAVEGGAQLDAIRARLSEGARVAA